MHRIATRYRAVLCAALILQLVHLPVWADDPESTGQLQLYLFDLALTRPDLVVQAADLAQQATARALTAGDRVAIATHGPAADLTLVLAPTKDLERIDAALGSLREEQGARVSATAAGPEPKGDDLVTARARDVESAKGIVQMEQGRVLGLVQSLTQLRNLAQSNQGSSQVVLFSEGFDSSVVLGNTTTNRLDQAWMAGQSEAAARGEVWAVESGARSGSGAVEAELFEMLSAYKRAGIPIQAVKLAPQGDARPAERGAQGPNGLWIMAKRTKGQVISEGDDLSLILAGTSGQ